MGWFWYIVMLIPVAGFVQVGQQAYADRYMYIPSIGIFTILVWELARLFELVRKKAVFVGMICVALGGLSFMARQQVLFWQDSDTLFSYAISVTDKNELAWLQKGNFLFENGHYEQAKECYLEVLRISPDHFKAQSNMGLILLKQGALQEALLYLQKSLARDPGNRQILNDMGTAYLGSGDVEMAIGFFRKALVVDGKFKVALFNLALSLERFDQLPEAKVAYNKLLALDASFGEAYNGLGVVYSRQGKYQLATQNFKKALVLMPDFGDARQNIERLKSIDR